MPARVMVAGRWAGVEEILGHPGHSSQKSHGRRGGPGTGRNLIETKEAAEALAARVWSTAGESQFGPHGDEVLHHIVKEQGFGPTEVVPKGQMDAIRAEHRGMFRGVGPSRDGKKSGDDIHNEMATDAAFQGRGVAGNGTYMTSRASEAAGYGTVRAYALHKDARVVQHNEMHAEQKAFLSQLDRGSLAHAMFSDRGRFAAARGYDAYEWEFSDPEAGGAMTGRWVVLNRGALFMEEA